MAIYENLMAIILNSLGKDLYYLEKASSLEVDFVPMLGNQVTAIEVKSADNTQSKSLKNLIQSYPLTQGVKLSSKNTISRDSI